MPCFSLKLFNGLFFIGSRKFYGFSFEVKTVLRQKWMLFLVGSHVFFRQKFVFDWKKVVFRWKVDFVENFFGRIHGFSIEKGCFSFEVENEFQRIPILLELNSNEKQCPQIGQQTGGWKFRTTFRPLHCRNISNPTVLQISTQVSWRIRYQPLQENNLWDNTMEY